MTEDEICDMVIECIKAAKENKRFQYCSSSTGKWINVYNPVITNIIASISMGTKYRVKPKPKTMRVRWYWIKSHETYILGYVRGDLCDEVDTKKLHPGFHSWADDEQILTVPEAE